MDLSALHGERLGAAAAFVAATLVLAVQLITPSPVVVSVGENGARTTQLGQYFTYADVGLIAGAAVLLGASGTYLLLDEVPAPTTGSTRRDATNGSTRRDATNGSGDTTDGRGPVRAVGDGTGGGAARDTERQRRDWEEALDRLRGNEEDVYAVVLDADGRLPQRDVVETTDLSKASVSRTLDTLESKGLVERKRRGMGNVVVLQ